MTDSVSFQLHGMDEVQGKLDAISHEVKYKGGRFALRKAANLVAGKAKENADKLDNPDTDNKISDYIAVRWSTRTFKSTGDLKFRVGVQGGARYNYANTKDNARSGRIGKSYQVESQAYYWRFLEFGTSKMSAKPFFRKALADNVGAATAEFAKHFPKAIDRALRNAKKKAT